MSAQAAAAGKAQKQPSRPRHVPQRTCVACRRVAGKRALIRLVRIGESVEIDETGKKAGRGMYLHGNRACWAAALRSGRIEQALKVRLGADDRERLTQFMATLPEVEDSAEKSAEGNDRPAAE